MVTAIVLTPCGSSTVHIYTQTVHGKTQLTTEQHKQHPIWKSEDSAPSLRVLPGIFLTTEEKARKTLSQGKKNLSQSTVYILPKHPHITKPTHTHTHTQTHTHAHTLQTPHIHTHTHTHTHTLQNNIKPSQYKLKQTQCKIYPKETVAK